jgi:hypothetical protein
MIVDKINTWMSENGHSVDEAILNEIGSQAKFAFARQFGEREERAPSLRLSSIGRCLRQQAYQMLGEPQNGKETDSRSRMVFFQGDLVEMSVVALAMAAGCDIRDTGQAQLKVELDGIVGHPDGTLQIGDEKLLLEVKSMSSFSFAELQRGQLEDGYRYQINAYLEALGLKRCVLVALNKDAGVLHEMIVERDPKIIEAIKERIDTLKKCSAKDLPYRSFGPDAKNFLPWQCRYCAWFKTCWPKAELVLVGKSYKLKIPKEKTHETTEKEHD